MPDTIAYAPNGPQTVRWLQRIALKLATEFGLKLHSLSEESASSEALGTCDEEGRITVRIYRRKSKVKLSAFTILNTLAHELAHLGFVGQAHRGTFEQRKKEIYDRAQQLLEKT